MIDNDVGEIRRSSVVMSFAPGAIMDMRADGAPVSGVSAGLEEWDQWAPMIGALANQKIYERRLLKKLAKAYFRLPPVLESDPLLRGGKASASASTASLILRRFPEWLQCPVCSIIKRANAWDADPGKAYRYCAKCSNKQAGPSKVYAVPVRFATACVDGHLDEFPWDFWVRHMPTCKSSTSKQLKLVSERPGLGGLVISCPDCSARRSLDGAFRRTALRGLTCRGRRPWLRSGEDCSRNGEDGTYRVVQRGASNLYYPVLETALDIPPWTGRLESVLADYWDDLEASENRLLLIRETRSLRLAVEREGLTPEETVEAFELMLRNLERTDPNEIRWDEYRIFDSPVAQKDPNFETHPAAASEVLAPMLGRVSRVSRLREVRVVRGFTRINAPVDGDLERIAPISNESLDWLPAVEIRGEGIFVSMNLEAVQHWESQPRVQHRAARAQEAWQLDWASRNPEAPLPFLASPRLLLTHTFAHALIRQLTLECGYSSASLRERLYVSDVNDGMCGFLIYTGTPDSDGTLGGLQSRARLDLFEQTAIGAVRSMMWCSSDPLCIQGEVAAPDSCSVASCHGCTMVPETSCELHNKFLDRGLVVGDVDFASLGFFEPLTRL